MKNTNRSSLSGHLWHSLERDPLRHSAHPRAQRPADLDTALAIRDREGGVHSRCCGERYLLYRMCRFDGDISEVGFRRWRTEGRCSFAARGGGAYQEQRERSKSGSGRDGCHCRPCSVSENLIWGLDNSLTSTSVAAAWACVMDTLHAQDSPYRRLVKNEPQVTSA